LTYADVTPELLAGRPVIINTTPLGMFPQTCTLPQLPYEALGPGHFLYDLVYNPSLTLFLEEGKKRGATIANGENMLRLQAEENWRIWNS
jgi:shikimate dehydrogenase